MHDVWTATRLTALERRLGELQRIFYGVSVEDSMPPDLLDLYLESTLALGRREMTDVARVRMLDTLRRVDEVSLLEFAEQVSDPFPWRPFLLMARRLRDEDPTSSAQACVVHLHRVAKGMLNAQGLGLLEPEDLLLTPSTVWEIGAR